MAASMGQLAAEVQQLNASLAAATAQISQLEAELNATTLYSIPGSSDVNVGFTLLSAYLVFFMQAGFAMLSAGSVRAKNAKNIILLNLLDACFGCMAWYATGWAFAFGDPPQTPDGGYAWQGNPFIGHKYFFQAGLPQTSLAVWFFQFTFAATSATIVSGAVAERCRFECYVMYNLLLVSFVYPVVAHWVWSSWGWMSALRTPATASSGYTLLFNSGVYDFAGDGPVHMVGGFASLVGAWALGPRIGRFDAAGHPVDMPGHNASLTLLGVFLLWFGWYGFNPGSSNAILGPWVGYSSISAAIAVNTTVSAAAATISTLLVSMLHNYWAMGVVVWDLIIAGNGSLAGLVAITGPCAFVDTWGALIIGGVGGGVYYGLSKLILHRLRLDDPLDAIAVHAGGAVWGMLACAALASQGAVEAWYGPYPSAVEVDGVMTPSREYGFVMGGSGNLLAAHVVYILAIAAWVCGIMLPFFLLLKRLGLLRVPRAVEATGLDISYHGGSSYPHDHGYHYGAEPAAVSDAAMTRDQVESLLEGTMMRLEKRLVAQQRQELAALQAGGDSDPRRNSGDAGSPAGGSPTARRPGGQQAVRKLRPLAEGEPLRFGDEREGGATGGASALPRSNGGGLPRPRSLGELQQAVRGAHGGVGGGSSEEGSTKHSHVSFAEEVTVIPLPP